MAGGWYCARRIAVFKRGVVEQILALHQVFPHPVVSGRVNIYETGFGPYDLEGPVQDDMSVLKVSYSPEARRGTYVMRMEPGAETIPHVHKCMEEFLILEGELIESDGTVLKKGDFASYRPGTRHNSRTETGCLLVGVDWDPPEPASGTVSGQTDA